MGLPLLLVLARSLMKLLIWFFVSCFLTANGSMAFRFSLLNTLDDCCDGREGVKFILLRDWWLIAVEPCSNSGSNASKRVRYASISYETLGTGANLSGEDFQNRGTFIVVRSSVFAKSSAQKTHLARDAYNAYSRRARRCQVQNRHHENRGLFRISAVNESILRNDFRNRFRKRGTVPVFLWRLFFQWSSPSY